jgi:hypothetical protein
MNEELREHVTRVGFNLTLSKTQIEALVWLDLMRQLHAGKRHPAKRCYDMRIPFDVRYFVSAASGLQVRGLVAHFKVEGLWSDHCWNEYWQISRAGDLVIDLLKECGIYEEHIKKMRVEAA